MELVVREREVKWKRESEGGKGKSKICFVCGPVEAKKMGRHLDYHHLPWWISPATACWTCQQVERSLAFLRARHSNCGGYWETEERFRRWAELVLGLLDFLRASLGCATLEAFLGVVGSMGLEEEPVSHGQKCIINALSLVTGEHLISVNWPHPASLAELSARPVIRALLPLLQRNQLEVVRTWNRPFAVAPFPGEVRTIDSHCHVDTLVARGARVVDLFSGNGARLDLIVCSLNFPVRWNLVSRLGDDRLRWTVGFHPHVTSLHIPEPVWERQSVLWQNPRCVALGEVGLDYTHDEKEWVLQQTQLVRILQTAPVHLPLVLHCREGNGGDAHSDLLRILSQQISRNRTVILHSIDATKIPAWKAVCEVLYFCVGSPSWDHLSPTWFAEVTLERILVESDAPYQLSLPTGVLKGLQKLSKVAHLPVRVVAEATRLNATVSTFIWVSIVPHVTV